MVAHRLLGQASPFAPYISNLPMGVPGLPIFYSGEALGALQYPPVTEQVPPMLAPASACARLFAFTHTHTPSGSLECTAHVAATAATAGMPLPEAARQRYCCNAHAGEEALPLAAVLHAAGAAARPPRARAGAPFPRSGPVLPPACCAHMHRSCAQRT